MREMSIGIAVLGIIVVVSGIIYGYELWKESQPLVLREKDFGEMYYIGYFENKSVFSSSFITNASYDTPFNKNDCTPLKFYMGRELPSKYPDGWGYSTLGRIEGWRVAHIKGLYTALKGMKEGEEKIIELDAKDAFGMKPENGTLFNTSSILGFNTTFEIVSITENNVDIRWKCKIGDIITMPQFWYNIPVNYPYWLWENATEVVSFNETHVVLKTTPDKLENITLYPWWENMSTVRYDDEKIWITTSPLPNSTFQISTPFGYIDGKVINVTEDKIKVVYYMGNASQQVELNRTEVFNRTIELPIIFRDISKAYLDMDLRRSGYSFHRLAGKKVIFRIKLIEVHRLS